MKGRARKYSLEELAFISARRGLPRRELHAAYVAAFGREDVSLTNLVALCKRKGWLTGRNGRFLKGQAPANKGKRMPFNANGARTQFKKGNRSGRAAEKYQPIGTERLCKDGYLERKIHDGQPRQSRWRAVHLVRWEEINGPVPDGMCLKCLDGDRLNTDPTNWKLLSRALLPRLAGRHGRDYDVAPAHLKPTIMATAELQQLAAEKRKVRS